MKPVAFPWQLCPRKAGRGPAIVDPHLAPDPRAPEPALLVRWQGAGGRGTGSRLGVSSAREEAFL